MFQLQKFYGGAGVRAQGEAPRKNETRVKNRSVFIQVLGRRCVPATKNGPGLESSESLGILWRGRFWNPQGPGVSEIENP